MRKVFIKDIGKVITGKTPSKTNSEFYASKDIGFVKPDIISDSGISSINSTNEYISEKARSKARIVEKDTVFVTCIGTIGKVGIAEGREYAFNQQINAIEVNEKAISKYLAYNLLSNKNRLVSIANAPVVPIINKTQFENFEIFIDENIDSQKKIVNILDKVSQIILLKRSQLNELDNLIKSRFVEMFGTLDTNEKEFDFAPLKDLCSKITDGKHGGCEIVTGTGCFFVGAREIYDGLIHYDTAPEISHSDFEKDYRRCNVEKGDFLIVNTGATIGKSAIALDERTENTLIQKSVALIKTKKNILLPVFLQYCYVVNPKMYLFESSSAQPNLLLSKIKETVVYVPSVELQKQFAIFVHQVDKLKFRTDCVT